jgi:predicted MFS family arabinose efflux permease
LSFSAAGDLAPERTDEIVARLNLFNYVGVLVGSAAAGIIADSLGMPIAIAIPAVLVLAALFAVPAYRVRPPGKSGTPAR